MATHIVAPLAELPPGSRLRVEVRGRGIAVFNVDGKLFAISDRCPHMGGSLCKGRLIGLVEASEPGQYQYSRPQEILRCPWHGWEFDLATGRSRFDPDRWKVRAHNARVVGGADLAEAEVELVAETFPVRVEDDYVVVEA